MFDSVHAIRLLLSALALSALITSACAQPFSFPFSAATPPSTAPATTLNHPLKGIGAKPPPNVGSQGRDAGSSAMCSAATTAAARLICAEPDLSARDAKLATAFRQLKSKSSPAAQQALLNERLIWVRERDQRCGLAGKDGASLDELRKAKGCMLDALNARLAELQKIIPVNSSSATKGMESSSPNPETSKSGAARSIASSDLSVPTGPDVTSAIPGGAGAPAGAQNPPAPNQDVILTPLTTTSSTEPHPSRARFNFSISASGLSGTVDCLDQASATDASSAAASNIPSRILVRIVLNDDPGTASIFEGDAWRAQLDRLRQAIHGSCSAASDRSTTASERSNGANEIYKVNSTRGLFVARSGGSGAWIVEKNLPQTRKKVQADLGVQKWLKPSVLTRNPYFFKDIVAGMVVHLDHKISDHEAVFTQAGAQIFVSGVPRDLADSEALVLSARVVGNKGVVDPSGSERLIPALDYLNSVACANVCEALSDIAGQ
jgi:uncharacterized protein YecT (DUF1311 family)